ncbi:MAG TPA: DUF5818 domain-containing protein [Terriglobales bacterium]|jgi:hypothetical protein|nr:DUF5818 domain-containing protein [Terriglobales bacterium]
MKTHLSALCSLALLAVSLPNLFAQNRPSQPVDPTAQAPATRAPATPPTFPTPEAKQQSDRPEVRVYMGAVVHNGDSYVLKTGNQQYLLDSQKKARKYKGKDVKITGTLDKAKNLIHVKKIDESPSM